jgi:hypothetical protein
MIVGAHSLIYSTNPDADRAFLRDVLALPSIDSGGGWLIFGLPPAEVAVHPSDKNDEHEFYLMCDDVAVLVRDMEERNVLCTAVEDRGWGLVTRVKLPGGGSLGVYEPRHARPAPHAAKKAQTPTKRRAARKPTPKKRPAKPAKKKSKRR